MLKSLGIVLLAACLAEPLLSGVRPRTGANLFAMLADNSQSLTIRDGGSARSRGEMLHDLLARRVPWQTRLSQDFDVRRYMFDARLRAVDDFAAIAVRRDRVVAGRLAGKPGSPLSGSSAGRHLVAHRRQRDRSGSRVSRNHVHGLEPLAAGLSGRARRRDSAARRELIARVGDPNQFRGRPGHRAGRDHRLRLQRPADRRATGGRSRQTGRASSTPPSPTMASRWHFVFNCGPSNWAFRSTRCASRRREN